ncbi:LacI family DNA-binding transcriptional regulator [Leifsonia sp. 2MCAF36]|uniref:LacI family DNA-binding transcriptional regulator n=1 Tax=Leifsonia sp. 2MCAF36 TaxID=3232988 RepID=UPI003F9B3666
MSAEDRPAKVANIFDVARLASVSHQTVSRVLNDVPGVRPATRQRVEQAIKQLRYTPSPAARALVTRRTRMIGLITPGSADFGPSSIAIHFSEAAREARYSVIGVASVSADVGSIRGVVESLLRERVEAVVLIADDVAQLDVVRTLEAGVPIIAVAAGQHRGPLTVSIDQYRGAREAVRHLVALGHRSIAHLAGPEVSPDAIERVRGWRDELAEARLVATELSHGDWSAESGYRFGMQLAADSTTAVFVANDQMAIGLMAALRGRGLRIPEDISVVGFDDVPEAAYFVPPLTTVRQDFGSLGALTMQQVLIALEEPETGAESIPIPTRLVLRESTAPPRP